MLSRLMPLKVITKIKLFFKTFIISHSENLKSKLGNPFLSFYVIFSVQKCNERKHSLLLETLEDLNASVSTPDSAAVATPLPFEQQEHNP